ncbi:MAG: xanthine dehydrogenase family protein molybdopterin-binding subunit [Proteobacteria bacterium]|nr:xanthine dehydrogenase family protein molybdopterin-binding subunit [Pseudomonadota bacterium]
MKDDERDLYFVEGIAVPQTPLPGEEPAAWGKTTVIGQRQPRVDAYERVSGTAVYPSDVVLPNMLYGALLRCPHAHARVKKVDISAAERMEGVHAILTGASLAGKVKWPYSEEVVTDLFDAQCRFEGEAVAAVAATTPYVARDALRAIAVEYEVLPFVADERESLAPGAAQIHAGGNRFKAETYERGDVNKGFAEADVVLEEKYRTACEIQSPMELHGCVANWEGDSLTIWESTQGVYAVQAKTADILGLPLSKVRVIGHYMGGGFGAKLQPGKYTICAALLARKIGRPVKIFLSREEAMLAAGNRPPANMTIKAGVKKDGTLTALQFSGLGSGGAYPAGGTSLLDWLVRDLYVCPNVQSELTDVAINAGPARPFRAPGHPQCAWALEQMMDALAEAIGMDPVDLRLKNVPLVSQGREGSPPYTTTGLSACITEGAEAFGWREARRRTAAARKEKNHLKRGVGMGSCVWFVGGGRPPSTVIVKLFADGSVNLNMGASDIGTGTKTVMSMVLAEELGVRPETIQIEHADTGSTQYATPSGGSKTVPTESPAVRSAAIAVKQQLLKMAAGELGSPLENLRYTGEYIEATDSGKKVKITDLASLKKQGVVVGIGYRGPNPEGKVVNPFAAQFCEVEVNTRTGEVRILRFLGAHESGRVMDRLTFDNQVFGGITMGIGLGMTEKRILDANSTGKMVNRNLHDYKLPTALDVPEEMVSLPVDMPDSEANNTGAKGLGEPVTIPTAAAIANAIYDAVGVRVRQSPADPLTMNRLLAEQSPEERS